MKGILISIIYVFVSCLILLIGKYIFNKTSPFKAEDQIKEKNPVPIIAFSGYMLGLTLILAGAFLGNAQRLFRYDLLLYVCYALLGLVLMNLSTIAADKLFLSKFSSAKEMIEDKNIGTAAVHFGVYLATGLIIAGCVTGDYGGIVSTLIYYVLGMVFLFIFIKLYDLITPYSIHDEIEKDNFAAGIALGGNIIAIGIILMKATLGDVSDWHRNFILYFIDLASIILLVPSVRYILGNFIIRNINNEIKANNVSAGITEFVTIVCFAVLIFFMVDFGAFV